MRQNFASSHFAALRLGGLSLLALALPLTSCGSGGSSPASGDRPDGSQGGTGLTATSSGGASSGSDSGSSGGDASTSGDSGGSGGSGSSGGGGASDAQASADWSAPDVGAPLAAGSPGQVDVTFTVAANQSIHEISPYIYGVNDGSKAASVHATIVRSGGNRLTAYNWENNASNAGSDYMFQNDDYLCGTITCSPSSSTAGAFLKAVVDQAHAAGAAALITVPIVDYVSADKSPGGDVRNSGSNYLSTRFKQNKPAKGSAFAYPPSTTDAYVYEDEMVHWLSQAESTTTFRWLLDNEPDLWSSTHAEVHPTPVTYAELAMRNIEYAKAIKAVVPGDEVWGPVNYGWQGYVNLQSASDSAANGDFVNWWLGQMASAGQSAGKRLIDGLDLHWYPEATGNGMRIVGGDSSAPVVSAREQAPRSLWDSTYTETSWITQYSTMGPINLIPRMMGKISAHYPGTKLSFSEWNYGGGGDMSGAIASADVLGIFGRLGVDMAMMWPGATETFTYAAFDVYRNYDGHGAAFGDTSVSAGTTDVPSSSVYASIQSTSTSHLVIVAINKATTTRVAGIVIEHPTSFRTAAVYTLTAGGGATLVPGTSLTAVATNALRYTMPAQSVTVIVPAP
jgi:hypothetical protein